MMNRLYYYNFAFLQYIGHLTKYSSIILGFEKKYVSTLQIGEAKKLANIDGEAALLSCSYLGKMTVEELNGDIENKS